MFFAGWLTVHIGAKKGQPAFTAGVAWEGSSRMIMLLLQQATNRLEYSAGGVEALDAFIYRQKRIQSFKGFHMMRTRGQRVLPSPITRWRIDCLAEAWFPFNGEQSD